MDTAPTTPTTPPHESRRQWHVAVTQRVHEELSAISSLHERATRGDVVALALAALKRETGSEDALREAIARHVAGL